MNRIQFISDPRMCQRLNELLTDPVMVEAMSIAIRECQPSEPVLLKGDLLQQATLEGMKTRGANIYQSALRSLTNPLKEQSSLGQEYDEAALQSLIKQGYSESEAKQAMKEFHSTQQ